MSMKVFRAALKQAEKRELQVCIGGGEPTLHPRFDEIVMAVLGYNARCWGDMPPSIVTNGSHRERAVTIAFLARKGLISAALSQDRFHDKSMVHKDVINAFTITERDRKNSERQYPGDLRQINGEPFNLVNQGRCDFGRDIEHDSCSCEGPFIKPNGDVHICGCDNSPNCGNLIEHDAMMPLWWPTKYCCKKEDGDDEW